MNVLVRRGTVRSAIALLAMLGAAGPGHAGEASAAPAGAQVSATIVRLARTLGGRPYRWAGAGPRVFDCSGLVAHIYAALGRPLPRSSFAQYRVGEAVARLDLVVGDLVFFRTYRPGPSHVGIYIGGSCTRPPPGASSSRRSRIPTSTAGSSARAGSRRARSGAPGLPPRPAPLR